MMQKLRTACFILLSFSGILSAEEPWKSKPVEEWTQQETERFFVDSLWVRQVRIGGEQERDPGEYSADTYVGGGAIAVPRGPSKKSAGTSRSGSPTYFVQWSSATVLRQASRHFRTLQGQAGTKEPEPPEASLYVLTIAGRDLKVFEGVAGEDLKASAYLRPKRAKTKFAPAEVRIQRLPDARVVGVHFSFARELNGQPVISDSEKSVEFGCKVKDITIKASFAPSEMMTPEGRDL